ncbi:MAG: Ig-like domain-containing protein [Clostridia bacterium]|nr:Ig-like domain-containing protein [Clostridia bacterium]
MKRFLSSVLIFLMVFSTIVIPVEVSAADALIISADTQSAETGETVTITLSASNNPGLSFLQVTLQYDTSVLTLEGTTNGNVFSTFEKGVNLQWSSDEDSTNNGILATLKFKVNENATAGNYAVNAIFREAYDSDINDVAVVVNPGAVIVTSELAGEQTVTVTAPVKGAVPQAVIAAGSGYAGTITWEGNPAKFAADTVYVANITLSAADYYVFADDAIGSVSGATVTDNSVSSDGSTLSFKVTFPKTADKDVPICIAPTGLTATYGQKLSDITIVNPAGNTEGTWTWAEPATLVGNVGINTFKATFTPINTDNYATVENIDITITVKEKVISVTGVALDKTTATLTEGETLALKATVAPENAINKTVTWTSSDEVVATVANGVVTAKSAGTATITVKTADGSKTATCVVTVKAKTIAVTGVSLNKTSATMIEGESLTLTATVAPTNATNKNVTWTSNNTSVATVSASGVVTAKSAGTAIITATTVDGGHNASCAVTVCPKTLTFSLDERKATAGKTVEINLNITNNPGIAGMGFEIEYNSDVMTLVSYESNSAWLPTSNFDEDNSNNPVKFVWSRASNFKADTSILTLNFEIKEDAPEGDYVVTLAKSGDIINQKFDDLACNVVAGKITVIDYIAGDVNSDSVVDIRDAVVLAQHLANWSVSVDMNAADCNADGLVDTKDAVLLARYLAKWDVTLG